MILIRRSRMEYVRVTHELDVARRQDHMQRELGTGLLKDVHRVLLLRRQRRDLRVRARVEPRERGHVHWVEAGVDAWIRAALVLEVEDAAADPFCFAR